MSKNILVKVITNACQEKILEQNENYLKVKLTAKPVKGQANAALIKLIAKQYKVPPAKVEIIKGLTAKNKLVRIYS